MDAGDDVRNGFLHTVSVEHIEAGLDKSGKVTAWRHRSVAPSIASTFAANTVHQAPFELGMGLVDMPFEIANVQCENPEAAAHARIGWFRSVSNIPAPSRCSPWSLKSLMPTTAIKRTCCWS